MKTILFLLFLSISSFAKEYTCYKNNYLFNVDLVGDKSTHLQLVDRYNYHTYLTSYAGSIESGQRVSSFYFYSSEHEPVVLSFLNAEIESKPDLLQAHVDAFIDGFILKGYFQCQSR